MTSTFLTSFTRFHPGLSPRPHTNEMCQSQDALLAAESTASTRQVRTSTFAGQPRRKSGMSSSSLPSSSSSSSLMAHTKLTGRSVALRRPPPTSPEARDYGQIPRIYLFPPIFRPFFQKVKVNSLFTRH